MSLQDRNAAWAGQRREFVQANSRSSSPRHWVIWVEGEKLHYQWGQVWGAMQYAFEKAPVVNAGKKNEVSAPANALALALRKIELKTREGYREIQIITETGGEIRYLDALPPPAIDFDQPLPQSLSFYKPINDAGTGLLKKAAQGKAIYTRKYNGMAHPIVCDSRGDIHIYSRRMLRQHDDEVGSQFTINDRFPGIVGAAARLMQPRSILLGEVVVMDSDGRDYFVHAQSITRSLTPQSIEDQQKLAAHGLRVRYAIWDIGFWNGEDWVSTKPVGARYDLIHELEYPDHDLFPLEIFPAGFFQSDTEAREYAKQRGIEGFVLVDPEGIYGDKAYNFKGKPDRPGAVCAKVKPEYEDDFVAYWDPDRGFGERSTKGRYDSGIKCVALYQYNQKGEQVYICNLNSGLTEEMKKDLADPRLWPRVFKVVYKSRTYVSEGEKTNALIHASYESTRTDKAPNECINPNL